MSEIKKISDIINTQDDNSEKFTERFNILFPNLLNKKMIENLKFDRDKSIPRSTAIRILLSLFLDSNMLLTDYLNFSKSLNIKNNTWKPLKIYNKKTSPTLFLCTKKLKKKLEEYKKSDFNNPSYTYIIISIIVSWIESDISIFDYNILIDTELTKITETDLKKKDLNHNINL